MNFRKKGIKYEENSEYFIGSFVGDHSFGRLFRAKDKRAGSENRRGCINSSGVHKFILPSCYS